MRVFILDDRREPLEAVKGAGMNPDYLSTHQVILCRTVTEAFKTIRSESKFDLWILDHDLGGNESGYKFLKRLMQEIPEKLPDLLLSCSSNFSGRENIETLFKNYNWFMKKQKNESVQQNG